jgi:hypothetical protein
VLGFTPTLGQSRGATGRKRRGGKIRRKGRKGLAYFFCRKKSHKGIIDIESTLVGIISTKKVEGCPQQASLTTKRSLTSVFSRGTKLGHGK